MSRSRSWPSTSRSSSGAVRRPSPRRAPGPERKGAGQRDAQGSGGGRATRTPPSSSAPALRPTPAVASVEQSTGCSQVLRLALPVYNEWKEFRGVVVLDLPMAYFTATLAGALTGRPGTSFLVDGTAPSSVRPARPRASPSAGRVPASWLPSCAPAGDPQVVDLTDGGPRLLVRELVGAYGWSVGVLAPLAETEGPVRDLTQSTLAYGAGGTVVLVLAVVLVAGARAGGSGAFRWRPPSWPRATSGCGCRRRARMRSAISADRSTHGRVARPSRRRGSAPDRGGTTATAGARGPQYRHPGRAHLAGPEGEPGGHPRQADVLYEFAAGGIRLVGESRDSLFLVAHRGLRPSYAANPVTLRPGEGDSGQALRLRAAPGSQ